MLSFFQEICLKTCLLGTMICGCRLSSLRTRSRAAKPTVSADASPKCENSTDPDWSPTASPRHEEAVSCSPAEGEGEPSSLSQDPDLKSFDTAVPNLGGSNSRYKVL